MWHEARKQERKLRGMMVDYKRRAERRREYYEKIKLDPTQFIRLHGRPCKINLDPAVAVAAEGPGTMMPWQGDTTNLIDRFDVRAHLDYIPEYRPSPFQDIDVEEKKCNYERYRTLVQNEFMGMTEEQVLYQIHLDDLYGAEKKKNEEKERLARERASIGFVYEDSTNDAEEPGDGDEDNTNNGNPDNDEEDGEDDEIDSDIDIDVDLDVDSLNEEQTQEVNSCGVNYGMDPTEYVRQLRRDKEEVEALRRAREEEEEKAMYSGRKSRRERRALIEKRLKGRKISPPSYARRDSPTYQPYRHSVSKSSSRSRSRTPENVGKMEFITSFGDEEEETKAAAAAASIIGPANRPQSKQQERVSDSRNKSRRRRSSSSSSSSSRSSSSGSSYSSRSRSRSRGRYRRYSRSRSRDRYSHSSRDRYYPRRPYRRSSRSRSRDRYRRSRSRSPRRYSKHYSTSSSSRSRSRSKDRYEHFRSYDKYQREKTDKKYDDSSSKPTYANRDQDFSTKKKKVPTATLR